MCNKDISVKGLTVLAIALLAAAVAEDVWAAAGDFAEVGPAEYRPLRRELRAFHPDESRHKCKSAAVLASFARTEAEVTAWSEAHPAFDALDLKREYYRALARHFVPVLFEDSPFYFEAGVNGGWIYKDTHCPARIVEILCRKFYAEQNLIPQEVLARVEERHRQRYSLVCGQLVDNCHHLPPFRTIFEKGFKGVRDDVEKALAACPKDDPLGREELETALVGLDTIHAIQLKFAARAKEMGKTVTARAAARCPWEPPQTFFEGLNTLWFLREILGLVDATCNFALGRPDAWLIGFYRAELAAGTLTEAEARDLVRRFMIHADCHQDGFVPVDSYDDHEAEIPLTLGGCDRDGLPVFNELTRMFLEEHLRMELVYPKLHVRFSRHSPQGYLDAIAEQVLSGHCVFAMFNDDVTVPGFVKHGLPLADSRDYVGCGCWDGNVDSLTDVDAANYMSVIRVLEETIYQDGEAMARAKVMIDPIDGAASYEEVERIVFANFLRFFRDTCSDYTAYGRANAKVFPHPVYSMCLAGGVESRRDTTDGGVRFRPRVMTLAFLANAVDSLCAIRKVVFQDRFCTLDEFLRAVRGNWRGARAEAIRAEVLKAPHWGDNTRESNELLDKWIRSVYEGIDGLRNDQGGPFVLACWIYREFMYWGEKTRATPDGRHDGDRLAQGFAPSEARCHEDVTSVINALSSVDHTRLYASNANLTFDKLDMTVPLLSAVFRVFAESGAHLLQPNCNSVDELLDAQRHPERYPHLMVKVCGFSARFISLSKRWQDEVIARHRLGGGMK